ncbi:MAG: hypothetical protein WAW03_03185 [Anaerolineae bacterium]|uniref:hypothetical protein n=1 Tax=Candidatus Amarolinea dominans TaxID=3140696 RepID=UPI00313677CD|nr:hypothetical protein [Anaerolineae bacterium]MBK9093306.1 hypothetical protein [Anaerolineae bacterium]
MIEWFAVQPWITGVVTFFLMWSDWLLTISQERERQLHYSEHYESYPINTIEGNPLYQKAVLARQIVDRRHIVPAAILSAIVALSLVWIPEGFRILLIGYVWGLYFIVITTHLSNLLGYRAARRGLHGKLYLHQRTGYVIQMSRYVALASFLIVLAICSASMFMLGVAIAGVSSAVRQLVGMRKTPAIDPADPAPKPI